LFGINGGVKRKYEYGGGIKKCGIKKETTLGEKKIQKQKQ
jgi:hypothetical protein